MNTPRSRSLTLLVAAALSVASLPLLRAAELGAPVIVPPAVAIARPSEGEVAKARETLQRFLAQADAGTKAVAEKYPGLISVVPPRANPCTTPFLAPNFRTKHAAFQEVAKKGDIDVLFMGDSITDWWRGRDNNPDSPLGGKAVFQKYFGHLKVANFGIAGDTTQGVLYRLRDGEGQGYTPKAIMLMIGTNSGGNASSAEIAEGVGAVVAEMQTLWPAAKILLLGIFPRGDPGQAIRKTVLDVNPIIAKLHDGKKVFYMDIGHIFLAPDGSIPNDIMPDKLHPNEKGYQLWADAVKQPLADLLK